MGARPVVIRERGSDTPPPAVIHLPHSSAVVPPEFRDAIVLDDEELRLELLRITDWFTDELFPVPSRQGKVVRFPLSRLVLDPERFLDDEVEPMAARGMGVIYTQTSHGDR